MHVYYKKNKQHILHCKYVEAQQSKIFKGH